MTKPQPEKKFGPFVGGFSLAIRLNTITTETGPRTVRSITITPRRYRDAETGEWKDGSFRPSDLRVLSQAIADAEAYLESNSLPADADMNGK